MPQLVGSACLPCSLGRVLFNNLFVEFLNYYIIFCTLDHMHGSNNIKFVQYLINIKLTHLLAKNVALVLSSSIAFV